MRGVRTNRRGGPLLPRAVLVLGAMVVTACAGFRPMGRGAVPAAPAATASSSSTGPVAVGPSVMSGADSAKNATPARNTVAAPIEKLGSPLAASDSARRDVTPTEIVAEVSRVFGGPPPAAQPVDSSATGPRWDIDVRSYETHDRVEHFVGIFSGRAKDDFAASLTRQTRYGAMIRQRLRAGGLPEDMIFLALVESWYDPHAYSSAAAVGMWQFMTRTARGSGMRVDWWVDERRDPVRSTEGAVRYLAGLKDQFGGSLYLAAAAYNGGDGRVSRGLALYADDLKGVEGEDRFFSLSDTKYLRPQTRDYVPKLIAAALVGKEPERYGLKVDTLPPFAYDSVTVPPLTPLAAIATVSGTTVAVLKELNPHILRGATPPGEPFLVRVPAGATWLVEKFEELPAAERTAVHRVESKKGDSMVSLAKKAGITSKQLAWYNPKVAKLKSGNLRAGQVILVPTKATVAAAMDVPDPSIERFPKRPKAAPAAKGKGSATAKTSTAKKPAAKNGTSKKPPTSKSPTSTSSTKAPVAKKPATKPATKRP